MSDTSGNRVGSLRRVKGLIPLFNNRKFLFGFSLFFPFLIVAILSPIIVPYPTMSVGRFDANLPPSIQHPFGTDSLGRDIADQIVEGIRYSLAIGGLAGTVSVVIGLVIGLIAGYMGGYIDNILMAITDLFLVVPTFPLLVTIAAYVRVVDIVTMSLILACFSWQGIARPIEAQAKSLRNRGFIDVCKLSGLNDFEIIFKEIIPNILSFLGVLFSGSFTGAMLAETGLSMIGLGPQTIMTLGSILNNAYSNAALVRGRYLWVLMPATCLILLFISTQLINIALDEYYNPRLRR